MEKINKFERAKIIYSKFFTVILTIVITFNMFYGYFKEVIYIGSFLLIGFMLFMVVNMKVKNKFIKEIIEYFLMLSLVLVIYFLLCDSNLTIVYTYIIALGYLILQNWKEIFLAEKIVFKVKSGGDGKTEYRVINYSNIDNLLRIVFYEVAVIYFFKMGFLFGSKIIVYTICYFLLGAFVVKILYKKGEMENIIRKNNLEEKNKLEEEKEINVIDKTDIDIFEELLSKKEVVLYSEKIKEIKVEKDNYLELKKKLLNILEESEDYISIKSRIDEVILKYYEKIEKEIYDILYEIKNKKLFSSEINDKVTNLLLKIKNINEKMEKTIINIKKIREQSGNCLYEIEILRNEILYQLD